MKRKREILTSPLGWKTVWVLAMFDLPTVTPEDRRNYSIFRKDLLEDGFSMMQFSIYHRHCASTENAEVHIERLRRKLPPEGEVRFLMVTDYQFSKIRTFLGKKRQPAPRQPAQLQFF
jgi:CRISPR-associated protein Cas2